MINAEQIHDALNLLPDELLAPVDALRQKKRFPWKSLTALAACLCLVVGLWYFFPGAVSMDSANGSAENLPAEGFDGICDSVTQESGSSNSLTANVLDVAEDHITILPGDRLPANATVSSTYAIIVRFDRLETVPQFQERQFIRMHFREMPQISAENNELFPYRIEILENEGG